MTQWLIIDGYNLICRAGDCRLGDQPGRMPRDMAGKRRHLIQLLDKTVGILAERITVVFDGRSGGDGRSSGDGHTGGEPDELETSAVEVLFSPGNKTADTIVEQLVYQAGKESGVVVVTSDRLERDTAEAAGAATMACSVFLDRLNETIAGIERSLRSRSAIQQPSKPLGNPFSSLNIGAPGTSRLIQGN